MADPRSRRTTVRRGASKAEYDQGALLAVLDAGLVAHVGVATPEGPLVLPMAYGRSEDRVYLHGAAGNALLGHAAGSDVCLTVTIVDGLVVGRSPFRNSMNYRGVVVRGQALEVTDPAEKRQALQLISDHVVSTWATGRTPTDAEISRTRVLAVPLTEVSGKVRTGGPTDSDDDRTRRHWGGHLPIVAVWGDPVPDDDVEPGVPAPAGVTARAGRRLP